MTDVLVISGPAGVGKSAVAFEMTLQLRAAAIPHALVDTDELDRIYPVPDDLPSITERNLAAVWETFSERGIDKLILVGVYPDPTGGTRMDRAGHPRCAVHPRPTTGVRRHTPRSRPAARDWYRHGGPVGTDSRAGGRACG